MDKTTIQSLGGIAGALIAAGLVTAAGSNGGITIGAVLPLFVLCAILSFLIQWLAFIPAWIMKTEHFFDLTGSITYLSLVVIALLLGTGTNGRSLLMGLLIIVWAVRLGSFLYLRVRTAGSDERFTSIKRSWAQFLMTWTLQGLWVLLTMAAALAAMTSKAPVPLDGWAVAGTVLWVAGFGIEVVADNQKRAFRREPGNAGAFITSGLWAWSRHPNYFGEILLWTGMAVIALPVLAGWQLVTLISPVFVYLLLTRISGIPMLESRARRRWGGDPDYLAYRSRTSRLIPLPPGGS